MTENITTPDAGQGLGGGAPDNSSGFAQESTPDSNADGLGKPQGVGSVDNTQSSDQLAQYEKRLSDTQRAYHEQQRKIAEYEQKMQTIEQRNQEFARSIAQQYGIVQPEQQQDLVSTLMDNPNYLQELINQAKEEVRGEYQQQFGIRDSKEYLANQNYTKAEIKQRLSEKMSPEMVEKMLDISTLVNPNILQLNQSLNDPTLSPQQRGELEQRLQMEFAQELQNRGGYESLVRQRAGEMLMGNFDNLMQDAAKVYQKKQFSSSRAGAMVNYRNGAQTTDGGSRYRTQSISR